MVVVLLQILLMCVHTLIANPSLVPKCFQNSTVIPHSCLLRLCRTAGLSNN